jgi:hypothetical protein
VKGVHLTLQGKGGIGKSYVAALLAQYHQDSQRELVCIDADPVNFTLSRYQGIGAERLELTSAGTHTDQCLDELRDRILRSDSHFLIDVGVAAYVPFLNYLIENNAIRSLAAGKKVTVHVVIVGGQAMQDTLENLESLAAQLPAEVHIVAWLNQYFGAVTLDGVGFEQTPTYERLRQRLFATIRLPECASSTERRDVLDMLERRLTFSQMQSSERTYLLSRQRLLGIKRSIFTQLAWLP